MKRAETEERCFARQDWKEYVKKKWKKRVRLTNKIWVVRTQLIVEFICMRRVD